MTKTAYDTYYLEEDHFGQPYKGLIEFFKSNNDKGTVLDLGCGQGRDAIPIAELGYKVIGVDHSHIGIEQMLVMKKPNIDITGEVADIYNYSIDDTIDIILMDSMLHFYKNDIEKESKFVNRILEELKPGAMLVNCMIKGKLRESLLIDLINNHVDDFKLLQNSYVKYPEASAEYQMVVIRKMAS